MHVTERLPSLITAAYKISVGMIRQKAFPPIMLMQMTYQKMKGIQLAVTTVKYGLIPMSLVYTLGVGHSNNHTLEIPW